MRGQVGIARIGQRIGGGMALKRLKRIAERAPVAIINDQGRAAVCVDARADHGDAGLCRGAGLDQITVFRIGQPMRKLWQSGRPAKTVGKLAFFQPDQPLAPAVAVALELADWQGVEEFVRDKVKRQIRQGVGTIVKGNVGAGNRLALDLAQGWRGLDQVKLCGVVKPRHGARRAQDIGHQGAAPRPGLGQGKGVGRALIQPALRKAQTDQLAKHLADLRRGDEITARAKRIAGGIIAMHGVHQAGGHIIGQRDRSALAYPGDQVVT